MLKNKSRTTNLDPWPPRSAIRMRHSVVRDKLAQSVLDYVLLICIVVVVLLIMGYYIRNSLSGRMRDTADVFGGGEVYLPGTTVVTGD